MKLTTTITAALILTSFASFAAPARILERESFTAEKAATTKGSGTNIGGGNNGSEYLATWCRGQLSLLRSFQARSAIKLEATSNYNLANKILTDGMVKALQEGDSARETFLHKSLIRGLAISNHLGGSLGGTSEKDAQNANFILNEYYNFMLEVIAKNLDLNGHIPYLGASNVDFDQRAAQFELKFVEYAKAQLDWILKNLVTETHQNGRRIVLPKGSANSVLKVAHTLTAGTTKDLEDSLWNYRFSCAISDLKILNDQLGQYNQGNREIYEDEKSALQEVTKEILRISSVINLRERCQ